MIGVITAKKMITNPRTKVPDLRTLKIFFLSFFTCELLMPSKDKLEARKMSLDLKVSTLANFNLAIKFLAIFGSNKRVK